MFVSLSLSPGCSPLVQALHAEPLLPRKPPGPKTQAEKNERQAEMKFLVCNHITRQWQTRGQRAALEPELHTQHFTLTCLCSSCWG